MQQRLLLALTVMSLVAACNDGVPKVDDPHKPSVAGQAMTPKAFLEKYCVGKPDSTTCSGVKAAMAKDATKGDLPKGW